MLINIGLFSITICIVLSFLYSCLSACLFVSVAPCVFACFKGMYKKSVEASQQLKEEEEQCNSNDDSCSKPAGDNSDTSSDHFRSGHVCGRHFQCDVRRSESIALLRAKAHSYRTSLMTSHYDITCSVDSFHASSFQQPSLSN